MLEHFWTHANNAINGFLCHTIFASAFISVGFVDFAVVNIEMQDIGLATTFNLIAIAILFKLHCDQHVFAIGLVQQILFANVGQC